MSISKVANRGVLYDGDQYLQDKVNPVPRKTHLKYIVVSKERYYLTPYDGYYISKSGILLSTRQRKIFFLKIRPDACTQYEVAYLYAGSSKSRIKKSIHQLMMETFYRECPKGYAVDHINSIRYDNRLANLRYLSIADNTRRVCKGKQGKSSVKVIAKVNGIVKKYSSMQDFVKDTGFPGIKRIRNNTYRNTSNSKFFVEKYYYNRLSTLKIILNKNPNYTAVK